MNKKKVAVADGNYTVVNGQLQPVLAAPLVGKNGLCVVWYKKNGKKYEMHPVDAKEALATGDYLPQDPKSVVETEAGIDDDDDDLDPPEKNIWMDEQGRLLPLTDDTSTKEGLIEALAANEQQVRTNDSKADILNQWNDYVKETMTIS